MINLCFIVFCFAWCNLCAKTAEELNLDMIVQANNCIKDQIQQTPIEYSSVLSKRLGVPVYLKLESQQITGSFKVRGALFYLSTLSEEEKSKGVAACSAGNHGLGVAYAAKKAGIPCTVYVPKKADEVKCQKIEELGAKVIRSHLDGYDETLEWTKNEVKITGQHLITAFDDARVMAGNGGTLAMEILNQIPDLENVIIPVGGGGLSSGLAYYIKTVKPSIRIIGCQLNDSPGLKLSWEQGKAVSQLPAIKTVAGGLEGGVGEQCFKILRDRIDDLVLLNEEEILEGTRWMLKNHQHLVEPSGIVTVSGCLSEKMPSLKGKTVVLLSGRNVSYETLKNIILENAL